MARILVTGGTGYLGGRLVQELLDSQHQVVIGTTRSGLVLPGELSGAELVATSYDSQDSLTHVLDDIDHVYHLASPNEVVSGKEPLRAVDGTISATVSLLDACVKAQVTSFTYLSTAHVYGAPLIGEITEASLTRPRHPYAITHRAAEDFALMYANRGLLDSKVVRLSNACGAPAHAGVDRWTLLVNDLCRQALKDRTLCLRSDGLDQRDFIPMTSAVRGIIAVGNADLPAADSRIFNVGSGQSLRVIDVAKLVADKAEALLGDKIQLSVPEIHRTTPPEPLLFCVERLRNLGFKPEHALDDAIEETLRFCQTHLKD